MNYVDPYHNVQQLHLQLKSPTHLLSARLLCLTFMLMRVILLKNLLLQLKVAHGKYLHVAFCVSGFSAQLACCAKSRR